MFLFIIAESQLDSQSLQDESTLDPVSPQDTVDDDNRSSSSSQDLLQSMDEISSGSLSPDTTDRASPLESGIGTASPPRSTDRRLTKRKMKILFINFHKLLALKNLKRDVATFIFSLAFFGVFYFVKYKLFVIYNIYFYNPLNKKNLFLAVLFNIL